MLAFCIQWHHVLIAFALLLLGLATGIVIGAMKGNRRLLRHLNDGFTFLTIVSQHRTIDPTDLVDAFATPPRPARQLVLRGFDGDTPVDDPEADEP